MPTLSGLYYFDNNTLSSSNSVYSDSSLTSLAPDGWYSDGTIVRQQVLGILQPPTPCPSCTPSCDQPGVAFGFFSNATTPYQGLYEIVFQTNLVGAIVIKVISTSGMPIGIRGQVDGSFSMSSINGSRLSCNADPNAPWNLLANPSTSIPYSPVFFGDSTIACGLNFPYGPAASPSPCTNLTLNVNLQQYTWDYNAGAFTTTLAPAVPYTINSYNADTDHFFLGDPLTIGSPTGGWMVLSRQPGDSTFVRVFIYNWVPTGYSPAFELEIYCPQSLPYQTVSDWYPTEVGACTADVLDQQMNFVSVSGNAPYLGVNDWVYFNDPTGLLYAATGYYKTSPLGVDRVIYVEDGRVISISNC